MILVMTTLHEKEDAVRIGLGLLKDRLIACYNLFPVDSAFWWKGEIENYNETLMLLKTRKENFEKIEKYIKEHSGYEVPEIIALEPQNISKSYLKWVEETTS